jgi:hypothetical protein
MVYFFPPSVPANRYPVVSQSPKIVSSEVLITAFASGAAFAWMLYVDPFFIVPVTCTDKVFSSVTLPRKPVGPRSKKTIVIVSLTEEVEATSKYHLEVPALVRRLNLERKGYHTDHSYVDVLTPGEIFGASILPPG